MNMAKKGFDPQKHIEKYGWEEGRGLGKTESGMKEAIKVKLKMDTAGVGHDAGEQFAFHWWDHVFNSAANSIQVNKNEGSVEVEKIGDCVISNKRSKVLSKDKSMLYGSFVKSATLENGVEEKESSSSSESDSEGDAAKAFSGVTDEQLFEACGGRTAHKGARHGLKLNGKLARIAQQEQSSAANSDAETPIPSADGSERNSENDADGIKSEHTAKKRKAKKSKKTKEVESEKQEVKTKSSKKETNSCKKKRKRDHEKSEDGQKCLEDTASNSNQCQENYLDNSKEHKNNCKKKRKKDNKCKEEKNTDLPENSLKVKTKLKKKKKKSKSGKGDRDL